MEGRFWRKEGFREWREGLECGGKELEDGRKGLEYGGKGLEDGRKGLEG